MDKHVQPYRKLFSSLALALGLLALVSWLTSQPTLAASGQAVTDGYTVYHVAPGGNCGGATPCYSDIQAAVDAMDAPGEVVKVATGVYTDVHSRHVPPAYDDPPVSGMIPQIVYITKTLTIQGGYSLANWDAPDPAANPTTLDAGGAGRVIMIHGAVSPTIAGLRITGGDADQLGGSEGFYDAGGGILAVSSGPVTIRQNQIFGNDAGTMVGGGGGVYVEGLELYGYGGYLIAISNTITGNVGSRGGGIGATGQATLVGNEIHSNVAYGEMGEGFGGGVFIEGGPDLIQQNRTTSNTAAYEGGGIWVDGMVTLTNNLIFSNTTTTWGVVGMSGGGGLYLIFSANSCSLNNVWAHNRSGGIGGGIFVGQGALHSTHDTFVDNGATALSFPTATGRGGRAFLTNTIMVSQSIGVGGLDSDFDRRSLVINGVLWYSAPVTVSYPVSAQVQVQNQYWGDPAFAADDYHILRGSAAHRRGIPTALATDIDGEPRSNGSAPDLGADELPALVVYLPLVMKNYP